MISAIDRNAQRGRYSTEVDSLTRTTTDSFGASGRGVDDALDAIVLSGRHE